MGVRLVALVCFASLAACSTGEQAALFVDLQTDFLAGEEFFAVQTAIDGTVRDETPAIRDDDFFAGQRIAEVEAVTPGNHLVEVRLLAADGSLVASRGVRVDVEGRRALTVLISRACASLTCPPERTCVRGACAPLECHEELSPASCGPPECASDGDCPSLAATCATNRCAEGSCLAALDDSTCGPDEYCDPEGGCRPRSVVVDATTDAPIDAIEDAAVDADAAVPCGPTDGLLGYWSLDATTVTGTAVADLSRNGRDGNLVGSPLPVVAPGQRGEALDFGATTTAYLNLGSLPFDASTAGFNSVSFWFFRADEVDLNEGLLSLPATDSAGPPRYGLWLNNDRLGENVLGINAGASDSFGIMGPTLLGRWIHVVAVFANGPTVDGSFFIDGSPASSRCILGICDESRTAMSPLTFGGPDPNFTFHGLVDEVRVYDRAITASEASALYDCAR